MVARTVEENSSLGGFRSNKMPGATMVFSCSSGSKNAKPLKMLRRLFLDKGGSIWSGPAKYRMWSLELPDRLG
jgi:hypothetical protein